MSDMTKNFFERHDQQRIVTIQKQCSHVLWEFITFSRHLLLEDKLVIKGNKIVVPEICGILVFLISHTERQGENKFLMEKKYFLME